MKVVFTYDAMRNTISIAHPDNTTVDVAIVTMRRLLDEMEYAAANNIGTRQDTFDVQDGWSNVHTANLFDLLREPSEPTTTPPDNIIDIQALLQQKPPDTIRDDMGHGNIATTSIYLKPPTE